LTSGEPVSGVAVVWAGEVCRSVMDSILEPGVVHSKIHPR
jgi:hypothetical protein